MGVLEFTASLVGSVAWPLTAVGLALVFRRQLVAIFRKLVGRMDRLSSMRAGSFEMAFEAAADSGVFPPAEEADHQARSEASGETASSEDTLFDAARALVDVNPKAAILLADHALNQTVYGVIREHDLPGSPMAALRELAARGVIAKNEVNAFGELRRLRNIAVHEFDTDISPSVASDYIDVADRTNWRLILGNNLYGSGEDGGNFARSG